MARMQQPFGFLRLALAAGFALLGVALYTPPAAAETVGIEPLKPRASFTVGGLEVVLVLAKERLYAFVDGVDDNVPASVDRLTVETGNRNWELAAVGPGLYVFAPFVLAPGRQPLTVDLAVGAATLQVATAIDIDKTAIAPVKPGGVLSWLWWIVAAIAVVALAIELSGWRFGAWVRRLPGGGG